MDSFLQLCKIHFACAPALSARARTRARNPDVERSACWVFRDVLLQDVVFHNTSFRTPHPYQLQLSRVKHMIVTFKPHILKRHIPELPSVLPPAAA